MIKQTRAVPPHSHSRKQGPLHRRAIASTLITAAIFGTFIAMTNATLQAQTQPADTASAPAALANLDFREVIRAAKTKVFPAVVYIKCVIETLEGGEKKSIEASGSGVIISANGEVLTNWHVIDKATSVRCLLSDGRAFDAEVLGSDKSIDFALLQLQLDENNTNPLPIAQFGSSAVLVEGDFVMAMGAPWGLNRSVSIGIVSCTRRFLDDSSEYSLWIQTDAAINPGNSGGPLVNTDGQIIGINTLGTSGDNLGFSIPSETIKLLLPQLRNHGQVNWSWTGLQLQPLHDFNRDMYFDGEEGVIVAATDPGSPAERAGLKIHDRILSIDGESLNAVDGEDLPAVRLHLGLLNRDQPVEVQVLRGEERLTLQLTPRAKGNVEGDELDCPRWDFTVKAINQFDNPDLHYFRKEGVFIYGIKYPGNAASSRLRTNDIIVSINQKPVQTLDDIKAIHAEAIANVEEKHRIMFTVLRSGGLTQQVILDFARDYSRE